MSEKVMRLEMSFHTSNAFIEKFNNLFCGWGQIKTPKDSNGNIRGGPAPLWANPSITFFRVLFVICIICSLLFIGSYVGLQFYKGTLNTPTTSSSTTPSTRTNTENTSKNTAFDIANSEAGQNYFLSEENSAIANEQLETNTKNITKNYAYQTTTTTTTTTTTNNSGSSTATSSSNAVEKACLDKAYGYLNSSFTVIGGAILFINAIYYLIFSYVDYGTDQEWSRYLVITLVFWLFLVGFIIADFLYFVQISGVASNELKADFEKAPKCKLYFDINIYINLIVPIISIVIAVLCLIKLMHLAKKFFMSGYVEHSAKCVDDNIVII